MLVEIEHIRRIAAYSVHADGDTVFLYRDFLSRRTAGSLRLDLQWNHCLCNPDLSRKLISQDPLPTHERAVADPMLPAPLPLWHTASVARFYDFDTSLFFAGFETRPAFLRPP